MLKRVVIGLAAAVGAAAFPPLGMAAPIELNQLYDPFYGERVKREGYLEFINPTEHPQFYPQGIPVPSSPPGVIQTEEYTGFTRGPGNGQDVIEVGDSHTTAGDRADFDWVQENRGCETGGLCLNRLPGNHQGTVGAMGWKIGPTTPSPHIDPGTGLPHNEGLPTLVNGDFPGKFFNAVDVFAIISIGQDQGLNPADPASRRAAALDYVVDFKNSVTNAFSSGVLSVVWIPGWTNVTGIDDFVARWTPLKGGEYDIVAIEPSAVGDQVTEIDAIKGVYIPEPGALALLGIGLAGIGFSRRNKA